MLIKEYEIVPLERDSEIDRAWTNLARNRPERAERLLDGVEAAVQEERDLLCRVAPNDPAMIEIFMIPARYVLLFVPDAVAQIRVDHSAKAIAFIKIVDDYGGPNEPSQWRRLQEFAQLSIQS